MLLPQLPHQKVGTDDFVGLGFFCSGADDAFQFGHGGGDEGFVALLRIYKNTGQGAAIMLNSNEGWPLMEELMQAIGKEYKWPGVAPKATASASLTNTRRYVGNYVSKTGVKFRVSVEGEGLSMQYGQQPPFPIFPKSDREFFAKAVNATIFFERGTKGRVVSLTVSQEGNQVEADRL